MFKGSTIEVCVLATVLLERWKWYGYDLVGVERDIPCQHPFAFSSWFLCGRIYDFRVEDTPFFNLLIAPK